MATPRVTWHCKCSWSVLSWLFMLCLSILLAVTSALEQPGGQQAASCRLNISGDKGRLQQVAMACTGTTTATVALHPIYLRTFQRQFTGVQVADSCIPNQDEDPGCLITICSGTIVLRGSSARGVPAMPALHTLLCVKHDSRLEVYDGTFANNQVTSLSVFDRASLVLHASRVAGNVVNGSGGGMQLEGYADVLLTGGSTVHGNTALDKGGGLAVIERARLTITNGSSVNNNTAEYGGGVAAGGNAHVTINSSTLSNNTAYMAGGGITAVTNASLTLANGSRISGNRARNGSGGGLDVSDGVTLDIRGGCSIDNNICAQGVGGGIAVGLSVDGLQFVGAGRLDGDAASVGRGTSNASVVISNSTIANNTSVFSAGGGLAVVAQSVVRLSDGTKVVNNTATRGSGGAVMLMGNASLEADSTVVFANNVVLRNYVGSTIVAFDSSNITLPSRGALTKCNSSVYLSRTPCGKGELMQHDVCICCPSHTYGFANSSCTKCPANAVCPGASIVEPMPGFWKSSPTSIQMHRCPLYKTACSYVDETHMCKPGYQGPLCGACKLPEYGMLSPMRCGRCMRAPVQLFLYLLVSFATVLAVNYTIHSTWKDNIQGRRNIFITDYIKVLVLFLQYLVIIGSVSVPWPLFDVQQWLQAIGIVVTLGAGQALSLDCWLYNFIPQGRVPIAIQRQLVYFLTPVFALVLLLALQWLSWAVERWVLPKLGRPRGGASVRSPFLLLRKLPVTVLVLVFYAYPVLARASLSFFACVRIDKPLTAFDEVPEGATAPLSHKWGYWASAITQQCFAGYHLGWSMGLGLPSVLFWCVGVPVAMGVGLYLCRDKADSDSFREHFGFLYRTYRPECMWWEAVWAARTVVLTLISVFAFPMQRYYSVLSLLLVFWASAALQNVFKPYEFVTLHRMHLVSTSCLAATTLGALAMFAYDIEESTANGLRIAITVLVFVINLVFVGWCFVNLAPALKEWWVDTVAAVKAWGRDFGGHGMHRTPTEKYPQQHSNC